MSFIWCFFGWTNISYSLLQGKREEHIKNHATCMKKTASEVDITKFLGQIYYHCKDIFYIHIRVYIHIRFLEKVKHLKKKLYFYFGFENHFAKYLIQLRGFKWTVQALYSLIVLVKNCLKQGCQSYSALWAGLVVQSQSIGQTGPVDPRHPAASAAPGSEQTHAGHPAGLVHELDQPHGPPLFSLPFPDCRVATLGTVCGTVQLQACSTDTRAGTVPHMVATPASPGPVLHVVLIVFGLISSVWLGCDFFHNIVSAVIATWRELTPCMLTPLRKLYSHTTFISI